MSTDPGDGVDRPTVAIVGVSEREVCGVRDHAALLAEGLRAQGVSCTMHWLTRRARTLRGERAEFREWLAGVSRELEQHAPDAVVFEYAVFACSHRGLPIHVRGMRSALTRAHAPVIVIGHEVAFPFGRGGVRGRIWAVSQRAALIGLVRACHAFVLTTDFRAHWLSTRRWLPKRPIGVAPVFSNLPAPRADLRSAAHAGETLGLFGYVAQGPSAGTVTEALAVLRESRPDVKLILIGAPGRESSAGEHWLAHARTRGVADAIEFSGILALQQLSDALASCNVLLCVDPPGPTSRKGTLAASLASGRPVVAVDGPQSWRELVRADAVRLAEPSAQGLSAEVRALLQSDTEREALGARGRAFHDRHMGVTVTARVVLELCGVVGADADADAAASPRHESQPPMTARSA